MRPERRHIAGSVLFGTGWAVADVCPGPIAAQLGQGVPWALATTAGLVLGIWLFVRRSPWRPRLCIMLDPEEATAAGAPAVADVPPDTRMGAVHLTVADLDRSIAYYETAIGLRVHEREGGRAALGHRRRGSARADRAAGRAAGATATAASTTSRCWCPSAPTSRAGSAYAAQRPGAARWACPITSSARRSTSATPTRTGSRSTGTGRARSGRVRSPSA